MHLPVGSLTNVLAVLVGGAVGLTLGTRLPERVQTIVFQGLGLSTLAIGVAMTLKMQNPLVVIFSVLIGGIVGAWLEVERGLQGLGDRLKQTIGSDGSQFTHGLITAFLLFCVGPMAILGAFDEGLRQDPTLLFTKSMLDGFAAIALASAYGSGVLFSVLPLFAYQYGLTLGATALQEIFSPALIAELTAVGGVLILGISMNLLKLAVIRLGDLLPSLLMVVLLSWLVE